jgi:hypothetical protein
MSYSYVILFPPFAFKGWEEYIEAGSSQEDSTKAVNGVRAWSLQGRTNAEAIDQTSSVDNMNPPA